MFIEKEQIRTHYQLVQGSDYSRLVHPTGIEPALPLENMDLNHTRLPVPPRVLIHFVLSIFTRGEFPRWCLLSDKSYYSAYSTYILTENLLKTNLHRSGVT